MFYNIQVLRALAALFVVWAHLRELFPAIEENPYIPTGLAGVDLFFVISGFIMVVSTDNRRDTPLGFLWKRLVRVAPLYYVFTFMVFAIALVAPAVFNSSTSDVTELVKSLLFIPFYKSEARIYPTYYLGWTLNYEMFFYLIFSIGLLFTGAWRVYVTTAIVSSFFIGGALAGSALETNPILYTYTRPIMLNFVLGMFIGLATDALGRMAERRPNIPYFLLGLGAVGFVLGIDRISLSTATSVIVPPTDTVLRYGIWAALIVMSVVALERSGKIIQNKTLLLIGNASFSLYLSHFFVIAVAKVFVNRLGLDEIARIPVANAIVPICVSVSILCYLWLEKPLHAKFGRRPGTSRPAVA